MTNPNPAAPLDVAEVRRACEVVGGVKFTGIALVRRLGLGR
jgi:hypothetical protein